MATKNLIDNCEECNTCNRNPNKIISLLKCWPLINKIIISDDCPCSNCIIKTVCSNDCEAFEKVWRRIFYGE